MRGKFIVIEGLEGAGKSSALGVIESLLTAHNIPYLCTREPGGTPMAEAIRECVKHDWEEDIPQATELLLMYAARSQLVSTVIKPALEAGTWVVADRHDWSSIAYQGGGRQVPLAHLAALKNLTMGDFKPDFTLYLDLDPAIGLARAAKRGELDRIELAGDAFFTRCRDMYLTLVKEHAHNSVLVNAEQEMAAVQADVAQALAVFLEAQSC